MKKTPKTAPKKQPLKKPAKAPVTPPAKAITQRPNPIAGLTPIPLALVASTRSDAPQSSASLIPTTVLPPTPYSITATGLVFDPSQMTIHHWRKLVQDLATSRKRWHALMADAISFGRGQYGDTVVNATIQQLELGLDDVRKSEVLASLPGDILHSRVISPEHAYIIARELPEAPPEVQARWAADAIEHKLDPTQLARCIQSGQVLSKEELKEKSGKGTGGILTIQGIVQTFRLWLINLGGPDAIMKLTRGQRTDLHTLLQPITDLSAQLLIK